MKVNKRKIGSGIIVVIFCSLTLYVYTMSTFSEEEYYSVLQNKYEKDIVEQYEKNYNDIENYYNLILEKNRMRE